MRKKALQKAAAAMSVSLLMSSVMQVQAAADVQAFPQSVQDRVNLLQQTRSEIFYEYNSYAHKKCEYETDTPPKYRFLFIEARNVRTRNGASAKTTEEDDRIFSQTVEQFEQVGEYLADFNVDFVVDTLILNDEVQATTDYVLYEDVQKYIRETAPYGSYDTVVTFTCENKDFGCPNSALSSREAWSSHGYAWVPLSVIDHVGYDSTAATRPEHLYTVDLTMHEWIHQLESFRCLDGIIMPSADIYGKGTDVLKPDETGSKYTNGKLEWDIVWPEDKVRKKPESFYRSRIEDDAVTYARAYFNGHIYDVERDRYVGMFPSFWRCYDGNCFFGEYYATDPNGKYQAFLGNDTVEMSRNDLPVYKDDAFVFGIYYSLEDNKIISMSRKFPYWRYPYTNTQLHDCTFTKISFDETGDYYLMNQANGKYLAFNAENRAFAFSDFKTDDSIWWTITYLGDNFVRISPKADPTLRFDVGNAWDVEDNPITNYVRTGVDDAQEYQLRQNADESYSIYPLLSYTRCVTNKDGQMVLATDKKAAGQKWMIEKADGTPISFTPAVTTTTAPVTTVTTTTTTKAPVTTTKAPVTTTKAPVTTTKAPVTTTKAPVTTTKAPVTTTKAPVTTTKAPVTTTKAPVTTTKAPVTTTKAPVTTTTTPVTTTAPAQPGMKGDANLDGSVDVADAVLIARVVAEDRTAVIKDQGLLNADVDNSGNADTNDLTLILKYIARLITSFD